MQAEQHVATNPVASITVQVGDHLVSGDVESDGHRYWATIDGQVFGPVGSFDAAIHRLAARLRQQTPNGPQYGLSANCTRAGWGFAFGTLASGRGGGGLDPCVARSIGKGPFPQLDDALKAVVRAMTSCCS